METLKSSEEPSTVVHACSPSRRKQGQEDHHRFEVSLVYTASSNQSELWLHNESLSLKEKQQSHTKDEAMRFKNTQKHPRCLENLVSEACVALTFPDEDVSVLLNFCIFFLPNVAFDLPHYMCSTYHTIQCLIRFWLVLSRDCHIYVIYFFQLNDKLDKAYHFHVSFSQVMLQGEAMFVPAWRKEWEFSWWMDVSLAEACRAEHSVASGEGGRECNIARA